MFPLRLSAILGVAGALIAPAAAQATVSSSAVTSITAAQQPFMSYDRDKPFNDPANQITVTGTTNGTTGDNVKIVCSSRNATTNQVLTSSTPVAADGSFTVTGSLRDIYTYINECDLRAVPTGAGMPGSLTPYTARRVQVGEQYSYASTGAGPNLGRTIDYYVDGTGTRAGAGYDSIGNCGLCDMALHSPTTLQISPELYGSNATMFRGTATAGGGSRPYAKIDGAPAYSPGSADGTNSSATGIPTLVWSVQTDAATGDRTITETDPMVTCPVFPVTNAAAQCPSFSPLGVTIQRTIRQNNNGQLVAITDTITSTDGNAHTFDFDYFQAIVGSAGYQFPGESGFSTHAANDVVAGQPGDSGVTQFIYNNAQTPSFGNPVGAMITTPAASAYAFDSSGSFVDQQTGTVPAGGSAIVRHIYLMAGDTTTLAALKASATDVYTAPTVTLDTPADVSTNQATVTGTASARGTLAGVKVNGVDATVDSAGNWAATIPVTPGANPVTAVATNGAGLTGRATGSVTFRAGGAPSAMPLATIPVTTTPGARTLKIALTTKATRVAQNGRRTTKLALACTGTGTCAGTVKVTKVLRIAGVRKARSLGRATYRIQAGRTVLVPLKLTRLGKKMLGRRWKRLLHAQVRVTQNGVTSGGTVAIRRTR